MTEPRMNARLVPISEDREAALKTLWQLLQERPKEAWISHDGQTTYDQHVQHVLYHNHRAWYLIQAGPRYVGSIYLTHLGEIGVAVLKEFQRLGYAKESILLLMALHPRAYYLANVAPGNAPSHRLWEGFSNSQIIQQTYRITPP